MHLDDLARAVALQAELKQWREAATRCNPSIFKHAILRVADAAHGHAGQIGETTLNLEPRHALPFIESQIERVTEEIRALGIEV